MRKPVHRVRDENLPFQASVNLMTASMTPRERVMAAIERRPVDRLPVMLWSEPHTTLKLVREYASPRDPLQNVAWKIIDKVEKYFPNEDIRSAAPLTMNFHQGPYLFQLGSDVMDTINFHLWKAGSKAWIEKGKIRVKDIFGCVRGICGPYLELVKVPCPTPKDLEDYEFPDMYGPEWYGNLKLMRRLFPRHALAVWVFGVQDGSQQFHGLENLYMGMAEYPEVIKKFFGKMTEYTTKVIRGCVAAGADLIMIGDDYGTQHGLLMGKDRWEDITYPCLKKMVEVAHESGGKVLLHSCGHVMPLLERIADAGVDALHPLQPTANNLSEAKKRIGDRVTFFTGIDVQSMLLRTPKEVEEDIVKCWRIAGKGGGLVLSCTHYLQMNTPMENLKAMFRTVEGIRSGRYEDGKRKIKKRNSNYANF